MNQQVLAFFLVCIRPCLTGSARFISQSVS